MDANVCTIGTVGIPSPAGVCMAGARHRSATSPYPFDLMWQGSGANETAKRLLGIGNRAPPLELLSSHALFRTGDSDTHHGQGRVPFKAV